MDMNEGTHIGYRQTEQGEQACVIPDTIKKRHIHLIGKPDRGKSLCCENMILNEISRESGIAVIDPHGDLIERLLDRIPESAVERTVLFDPSDPEWIPLYNPLDMVAGTDLSMAADNIVSTLKSIFAEGWGYRMQRILFNLIFMLMHGRGMSFLELMELLRKGKKSKDIIETLNSVVANSEALSFLNDEFKHYRRDELSPAINRLSPLTYSEVMSLSLFQPANRFDFQRIIDDGMIFLANLAPFGREQTMSTGGFMINSMYAAVLQRSKIPSEKRRLFSFYVDEAHLFQTDALEKIMDEARKYNVSFNLSHQRLSQFKKERADSLMTTGTTIAFCLGAGDAAVMKKNFQNKVTDEQFMDLGQGEALVRVDNDIAKITTLPPTKVTKSFREKIIRNSHSRYYKTVQEIRGTNQLKFRDEYDPFGSRIDEDLIRSADSGKTGVYDSYE